MDVEHDLDEYKGDVDFDFFDDDPIGKAQSPRQGKSRNDVTNKPQQTSGKVRSSANKHASDMNEKNDSANNKHLKVNGDPKSNTAPGQKDEDGEYSTDSYSSHGSDLSTSDSETDSSTQTDVSSVRSGTRTRNRPRSRSSSYSRSPTPEKVAIKNTKKSGKASPRDNKKEDRSEYSSDSSDSSSYSDSEHSDATRSSSAKEMKQRSEKTSKRRLHSPVEDKGSKTSKNRPVSAHPRKRQNGVHFEAWGNEKNNRPLSGKVDRKKDKRNVDKHEKGSRLSSDSESDSDMTDVSPLTSPRDSPQKHDRRSQDRVGNRAKKTVQYQGMPLPDEELSNFPLRKGETETLDLNILMKAVSELEKKKRVKENSRRVMFAPVNMVKQNERNNYTFSDDRTRVIERENQRLLHQIMKHVAQQSEPHRVRKVQPEPIRRPTASAINRQRQQTKIEQENLAILKRLQTVRPTRGMARDDQISQYQRTMLYGVPISSAEEFRKTGRRSRPSSAGSTMSQRSRSMSSVHSVSTVTSAASTLRSSRRPDSAKKYKLVDTRPEWSERW